MGCNGVKSAGLIQHSTVKPGPAPTFKFVDAGTMMLPEVPSNLKACPTAPAVKLIPPLTIPGLPPITSLALLSPGHQLTNPCGGFTHAAESRLGIIKTTHVSANIRNMYRFIVQFPPSPVFVQLIRSCEIFFLRAFLSRSADPDQPFFRFEITFFVTFKQQNATD
jgi:hypothetical protein